MARKEKEEIKVMVSLIPFIRGLRLVWRQVKVWRIQRQIKQKYKRLLKHEAKNERREREIKGRD